MHELFAPDMIGERACGNAHCAGRRGSKSIRLLADRRLSGGEVASKLTLDLAATELLMNALTASGSPQSRARCVEASLWKHGHGYRRGPLWQTEQGVKHVPGQNGRNREIIGAMDSEA